MTKAVNVIDVEYEQPEQEGAVCATKYAWARVPPEPSQAERGALKDKIRRLLKEKPKAVGLAVPGMPLGSPGMESARPQPYDTLLVLKDGSTTVWAKH